MAYNEKDTESLIGSEEAKAHSSESVYKKLLDEGDGEIKQEIEKKKSKNSGSDDAGCFLVFCLVVVLFLVLVAALMTIGAIKDDDKPDNNNNNSGSHDYNDDYDDDYSSMPNLTPNITTRPMPELDGEAVVIKDTTNPFPEIIESLKNGIVSVNNYGAGKDVFNGADTASSTGSGFVISSDGYIVTNAHVVEKAKRLTVITHSGVEIKAELIGFDVTTDVAVLKIDNSRHRLKPLMLGDSDKIRVGEFVITIGTPSGLEFAGTTTFGMIGGVNRSVNIDGRVFEFIQTDAAMNPGNSGGPLINSKGEVIGLNSAKTSIASYDENGNAISAEGMGFAMPINTVRETVANLITKGFIARPGIGVSVMVTPTDVLADYGLSNGLIVMSMASEGPADKAGIQPGDILLKCEGATLRNTDDLVKIIQEHKVGDKIRIECFRRESGERFIAEVTIGNLNGDIDNA